MTVEVQQMVTLNEALRRKAQFLFDEVDTITAKLLVVNALVESIRELAEKGSKQDD